MVEFRCLNLQDVEQFRQRGLEAFRDFPQFNGNTYDGICSFYRKKDQ